MDYTDLYDFQTSTGLIVPDDQSVLLGIQKKFQEIFGADIDLSAETPVGRLIEAFAVIVKTTLGVTAQAANQFNVNEATGIYLDALAQVYDLQRIAGTRTKITIKCYFSDNATGTTTIPAGSIIMCTANGKMFSVDSAITNNGAQVEEATGRRYAIGTATATQSGPIVAPIGSVNSIQSAVMGWIGVTNITPTYTGTDIETDEAFRERIKKSRPIGIGFNSHLVSALNRIDEVSSVCILENNEGIVSMKKGITIPPHSVYIGADFIQTDSVVEQIADEISRCKPVGIGMVNSGVPDATLIEVPTVHGYSNGYTQNISFYKVKRTPINVMVNYSFGNYTGRDLNTDIGNTVSSYIASVGAGGTIHGAMIANELINKLNIVVASILVQKSGSDLPADSSVEMDGYETPITSSANITVSEVEQ